MPTEYTSTFSLALPDSDRLKPVLQDIRETFTKIDSVMFPRNTSDPIDAYISSNKWLSVATSGVVGLPKQSACRMCLSTDQSIPTDTSTRVNLDTKDFDIQNEGDTSNHKITVTESGIYLILGQVGWKGSTVVDGKRYSAIIKVNGAIKKRVNLVPGASEFFDIPVECLLSLSAGDYIELYVWHNSGSNATILSYYDHTALSVIKVA